jgi:dynein heavy chain
MAGSVFLMLRVSFFGACRVDAVWWDNQPQSRSDLIARLRSCIGLNEKYQSGYKASLSNQSGSSTTTLNQISLFGKFDLFCRRLTKLVDLFSVISQFDDLARRRIDGMHTIVGQFVTLRENFRMKRHDFLDYHDNKFDRDYVEFVNGIGQVDKGLCEFVVASLGEISSNIEGSLGLVRKYKRIFSNRPIVAKVLDEESGRILSNFGNELLRIQDLYEKYKSNPPLGRNMPPVAGKGAAGAASDKPACEARAVYCAQSVRVGNC